MPVRDKFDSNAANSNEAIENAAQVVSGFEMCDMARILPRRFGASHLGPDENWARRRNPECKISLRSAKISDIMILGIFFHPPQDPRTAGECVRGRSVWGWRRKDLGIPDSEWLHWAAPNGIF